MSEILSNIVVEQNNINFTPTDNNINITPETIQLNVFTGAAPSAGQSSNGELLYNNNNLIDGVPFTSYANGKLTLGSPGNISITGGTNGYVLQTDGTGNLSWTAQSGGGGGNGSPGGANTQIQYNDSGLFGGSPGFTFDKSSNILNVPGNLIVAGTLYATVSNANYANFAGQVVNSAQSNITSVGTLTGVSVAGTTSIQQAIEKVTTNGTGSTGTVDFDLLTQAILYKTANASSNFTINIRGNSTISLDTMLVSNQSITCTYLNTNGSTGYYANVIQIDGTTITPKWILNGIPTSGTTNGIDSYTFNILKTASGTYTVLGSKVGFS